jgi:crotonobetainyl-CoA:carnitine CoA-transferase CaiB-like acyl-CoA transferase
VLCRVTESIALTIPADGPPMEPDLSGSRSVAYLTGLRACVAGAGTAASMAAGVLSALGMTVDEVDAAPDVPRHDPWDVVICDRVSVGAGDDYLDLVARRLSADHPVVRHCWVTASAFGLSGPARSFTGSDLVCAAAGGLLSAVFDRHGRVFLIPGKQALQTVGYAAALAALHGISLSRTRGTPVHMDLSAQDAVAFCTNQQTPSHVLHECGIPPGVGRYSAPSGPFPCTDGYIEIIVVDNHQFAAFSNAIGRPDWIPIFPEVADRVAGAEMIDEVVAEWSSTWTKDECEEYLQSRGVSATAVRPASEVPTSGLFRARGWTPPDPEARALVLPALVTRAGPDRLAQPGQRVLGDLHVLESSNVLAGPLTGAVLGAIGADVVRVEPTERLDLYRQNGPFAGGIAGIERGAYFQGANYSKRSVTEGVARLLSDGALGWADAVIENTGRKRLERSGIAPTLGSGDRDQVSLSISAFGRAGPGGAYRGYAPNVHAAAGVEDAIVSVAGRDITIRTVMADYASAMWAATLVAAWWLGGGQGSYEIDLSMAEVMAGRMIGSGRSPRVGGPRPDCPDRDEAIIDLGVLGYLAVSAPAGIPWPDAVARALDGQATDCVAPATAETLLRARADQDLDGTVAVLQGAGVSAYVAVKPEALPADPQLAARGTFVCLAHPVIDGSYLLALPWTEAGVPRGSWYRRAPLLGEHDGWARQVWVAPIHQEAGPKLIGGHADPSEYMSGAETTVDHD